VGVALLGLTACGSPVDDVLDLRQALTQTIDGFEPANVPATPTHVCAMSRYSGAEAVELPAGLGSPTTVAFRSGDAEFSVWAWRTDSPAAAAAHVADVVERLDACRYDLHVDSDTDGDGRIDAGFSETQSATEWSDEHWTGLAATARASGDVTESRFLRSGDVVLLAVLTFHTTDELEPALAGYLADVGVDLG
jgi:hypothetical protein